MRDLAATDFDVFEEFDEVTGELSGIIDFLQEEFATFDASELDQQDQAFVTIDVEDGKIKRLANPADANVTQVISPNTEVQSESKTFAEL